MKDTTFFRHLKYRITNFINRKFYHHSLFKDDVWKIRFSKARHLPYTTGKSLFTFSLKKADDVFKYLFFIMMAAMLVVMPIMSKEVGISPREIEQNHYTELLYNHFHSIGDAEAYKTHPYASTQAQYIDLILYSISKSFHIEDVFLIKHIVSSLFGWLIILSLSILMLTVFNWRAAFLTAFFMFISPRFLSYSFNNVVDVMFTFGFIFTLTQMYYFCRELPTIRILRIVKIFLGTLTALSCYNAGFVLLHFLIIFTLLNFFLYNPLKQFFTKAYLQALGTLCLILIGTILSVYGIHALCTLFLTDSGVLPGKALALLTHNYPSARPQLFSNRIIGPDNFPYHYFSKYLFITTPTVVLLGFLLFFIFIKNTFKTLRPYFILISLYTFFYCIVKIRTHYMNSDTVWAIHYIIYPLFMLIAVSGVECTFRSIQDRYANSVIFSIMVLLSFMPLRHIITNHPHSILYFNEISGGIHNTYTKYELDSNKISLQKPVTRDSLVETRPIMLDSVTKVQNQQ